MMLRYCIFDYAVFESVTVLYVLHMIVSSFTCFVYICTNFNHCVLLKQPTNKSCYHSSTLFINRTFHQICIPDNTSQFKKSLDLDQTTMYVAWNRFFKMIN